MKLIDRQLVEGTEPRVYLGHRTYKDSHGQPKVTKTYFAEYSVFGHQRQRSLGTRNKHVAIRRAHEIVSRIEKGEIRPAGDVQIAELARQYLETQVNKARAPTTITKYTYVLATFVAWTNEHFRRPAALFREQDFWQWHKSMIDDGYSGKTRCDRAIVIKQMFKWSASKAKLIATNPVADAHVEEPPPSEQPCFTPQQVAEILGGADPHEMGIFATMAYAGPRPTGVRTFIWDGLHGARLLDDVLVANGANLNGYTLTNAYDISANGLTIVGASTNPSGFREGWIATLPASAIPEPSSAIIIAVAAFGWWGFGRRRSNVRGRGVFPTALSVCATCIFFLNAVTMASISYSVLDLGTLGGTFSDAQDINASGQIAGFSNVAGNASFHAFRTAPNGVITAASDLGVGGGTNSFASDINDAGQVVGRTEGNGFDIAFRTAANGSITAASYLGTLDGSGGSRALGVNASGQVVGSSMVAGNTATHAFRTEPNGVITPASDLGTLGGSYSQAFAVNSLGQAVGGASMAGNSATHAFRTAPNGIITPASDLGTLGGTDGEAYDINDSGQVVGYSMTAGNAAIHAFRTAPNGSITISSDLGTLGGNSYAQGVNTMGQVVGLSYLVGGSGVQHAFFVGVSGPMLDLNDFIPADSGWVLNQAHGINDIGQIVGVGTIGGETHAFLISPVPEPGNLSLFAFAGLASLRRWRR